MNYELKNTSKFKAWISAMRLRTLPLSFSVILMGSAIAMFFPIAFTNPEYNEGDEPGFSWLIFVLTLSTTLFLQVLSNFANDYGDAQKGADNEDRIGPKRAIQSGILSKKEVLIGIIITSLLAFGCGFYLLIAAFGSQINTTFIIFLILGVLAIAAAIKYTIGKGAYGYFALGDLFVFLFFGILGVCGSFYLQDKEFHWPLLFPASQFGFLSVAVLNLNNMRDRINDQKVGKRTLAVLLGFEKSKTYHILLFSLTWVPYIIINVFIGIYTKGFGFILLLIASPIIAYHIIHIRKILGIKNPMDYDPELKKIALSTFVYALIWFTFSIISYTN